MFKAKLTPEQKEKATELILAGCSHSKIQHMVGVTNFSIYAIKRELGLYYKKVGRRDEVHYDNGTKDRFICPGLNGCGSCKRVFQPPCPMAIYEPSYEYDKQELSF
jgi:hypothetical protein